MSAVTFIVAVDVNTLILIVSLTPLHDWSVCHVLTHACPFSCHLHISDSPNFGLRSCNPLLDEENRALRQQPSNGWLLAVPDTEHFTFESISCSLLVDGQCT